MEEYQSAFDSHFRFIVVNNIFFFEMNNCLRIRIYFKCFVKLNIYRQHPHKVSTKDLRKGGEACSTHVVGDLGEIQFKDIGIIYVKRQDIKESLTHRQNMKIDPTGGENHLFHVKI